jgi:hypothetical protein
MKTTTMIKFMTKEELVKMLVQIKNFRNPYTHKAHHNYKTCEESWADPWNRAKYKFNMNNLDFADVLVCGEGYVRYCGRSYEVLEMLEEKFGFEEE